MKKITALLECRLFVVYAKPFRECVSIFPFDAQLHLMLQNSRNKRSSIGPVAQIGKQFLRRTPAPKECRFYILTTPCVIFQPRILARKENLLPGQRRIIAKSYLGKMNNGWDEFSIPKEVGPTAH